MDSVILLLWFSQSLTTFSSCKCSSLIQKISLNHTLSTDLYSLDRTSDKLLGGYFLRFVRWSNGFTSNDSSRCQCEMEESVSDWIVLINQFHSEFNFIILFSQLHNTHVELNFEARIVFKSVISVGFREFPVSISDTVCLKWMFWPVIYYFLTVWSDTADCGAGSETWLDCRWGGWSSFGWDKCWFSRVYGEYFRHCLSQMNVLTRDLLLSYSVKRYDRLLGAVRDMTRLSMGRVTLIWVG
jgi:hypothetical protein